MFFFCAFATADRLQLAVDLFEKNEWELCRRECRRELLAGTRPIEHFQLLEALSGLRINPGHPGGIAKLQAIVRDNRNVQISAMASYELGRLHWQLDQPKDAMDALALAFHTTTNKPLFLQSSCSIFLRLFKEHPNLKKNEGDLLKQITTSRSQWYGALFQQCAKPDPKKNKPQAPNWIVRFYRSQIGPAIGNRCVLEPSCSEYYHRAHVKHGLKSLPMMADRLFREPDVSNEKKHPVIMKNGQIRYRDPLENHDFWMKP